MQRDTPAGKGREGRRRGIAWRLWLWPAILGEVRRVLHDLLEHLAHISLERGEFCIPLRGRRHDVVEHVDLLSQITDFTEPQDSPATMSAELARLGAELVSNGALNVFIVDSLPAGVGRLSLGVPGPPDPRATTGASSSATPTSTRPSGGSSPTRWPTSSAFIMWSTGASPARSTPTRSTTPRAVKGPDGERHLDHPGPGLRALS